MSLQTKFAVLVSLFAATTATVLAAALLFGGFLDRELVKPFEQITTALRRLSEVKERNGALTALLPGAARDEPGAEFFEPGSSVFAPPADRGHRAQYEEGSRLLEESLRRLEFEPAWRASVGQATAERVREQISGARAASQEWFETSDPGDGRRAGELHYATHELVETIERRLIDDAPTALAYGEDLRRVRALTTYSGIAAAALFGLLCVLLFRRWVIRPVLVLRKAAVQIGQGDFAHRIERHSNDELGVLSREVNRMAGLVGSMQAEAVEKERLVATGEMVRRLAHNIRNPLSAIRGLAELSRRRAAGDEAIRTNQTEIIESVDRFNTWLTDLLSVTAPKGVSPESVEIAPWLASLIESHRPLARMRGVDLSSAIDGITCARFDPRHLEQAAVAVIANAIQASPAGGRVEARVSRDRGYWTLAISDQGPGVPAEIRQKIFRPYFTTKRDGTGIGLAIAKEVVNRHGGEISVDSRPEGGSIFIVRLPIGMDQPMNAVDSSQPVGISPKGQENGIHSGH